MEVAGLSALLRQTPGTHFYHRLSRSQCYSADRRVKTITTVKDLIGNRIRDLPACSAMHKLTLLLSAGYVLTYYTFVLQDNGTN